MDRSDLDAVRAIVAHDSCADGTASAVLLHDALPHAEVVFVDYGNEAMRLPAKPGMLFCDFSPPPERVTEFLAVGAIVLDHHRSAQSIVEQFGSRGVFADEVRDPGVAGAVLAFRHVWQPLTPGGHGDFAEWFAMAAGVRDTWYKDHPAWHDGCVQHALLMALPQPFWLSTPLATLAREWESSYAWVGEQLLRQERFRVERTVAGAHRFTGAGGTRVVAIPGLALASDLGDYVGTTADVIAAFGFGEEAGAPAMRVSLRSHAGFDCAAFAKRHGGGGHTRAAGFTVELAPDDPQPFRLIERMFGHR